MTALGTVNRDAEIAERVVIELDGRLFYDSTTARDRDLERDLDASLIDRATVRSGVLVSGVDRSHPVAGSYPVDETSMLP